eukprot:TRINITY_DN8101_c0_g1_i1.p1 TRINITY_DN8101_c0_g1~~TRINITY_DN8101_c0_g1_i1.p1  ORF type:complete len:514 (-),score=77.94 TRINITY_DN8101_c0_g1_i1:701-2242(-)
MAIANGAESKPVKEARALVAELCRQFYTLGWVSGTGGSISIKVNDPEKSSSTVLLMAPSGVQKERMLPEDMYVMDTEGTVLSSPTPKPPPHKAPKCSECGPLFLKAYNMRNAGAVIHSHGMETCLVTMLHPGAKEFRITHMEMIKGIVGHGYHDELVVPIIENTAREYELTDSLAKAMEEYPRATAVLVRNHGLYVWGDNWIQAKTQAECYHYLFDAAIRMHQMGRDPADPLHGPLKPSAHDIIPKAVEQTNGVATAGTKRRRVDGKQDTRRFLLLDIEGTTTPISFVADVLFPYARQNAGSFLRRTFDSEQTQEDIALLRKQIESDVAANVAGAVPVPNGDCESVVAALEQNVEAMIAADRKVTALKQLQGHIWREGYLSGELKGKFFDDVAGALERWHSAGSKVYIYSSGSREAQRLIFGYPESGQDLRCFLSGFFDTTTGPKREARSYSEIALSLGCERPAEVTFCTDVLQEAQAAREAGMEAVLVTRPGNAPLPVNHGFACIESLLLLA